MRQLSADEYAKLKDKRVRIKPKETKQEPVKEAPEIKKPDTRFEDLLHNQSVLIQQLARSLDGKITEEQFIELSKNLQQKKPKKLTINRDSKGLINTIEIS